MPQSLYHHDTQTDMHRGAIYKYRPIFWLKPPLWLLRNIHWTPPRSADVYKRGELSNAFRLRKEHNQEDVIARAKIRYVVILSNDSEAQKPGFKDVIVVPTYTVDPTRHRPSFLEGLRNMETPFLFYLPLDPSCPEMGECYINFREVRLLHKEFLQDGKLDTTFTPQGIKAILHRYKQYL